MEEGESPIKKKARTLEARSYQLDVLQRALKENVILYLGTGTGKTHIAVMLINSVESKLTSSDQKRIVVFLAPTVHLVIQQARVVSEHTELKVGEFYGDKGVDTWSVSDWKKEFDAHDIFVMTPQVFLDALSTSALKLETVELLIMDECHHAQKNHPYALIMKTHYHASLKSKPKIFGMTASPVIQKAVSSNLHCADALQALENLLDAKVFTLEGRCDVEQFAPSPTQYTVLYDPPSRSFTDLKLRLSQARDQFPAQLDLSSPFTILSEKLRKKISKSIGRLHNSIEYCLLNLGVYSAVLAVRILLKQKDALSTKWKAVPSPEERQLKNNYKQRFLEVVNMILAGFTREDTSTQDIVFAEQQGIITSKVLVLMNLLVEYREVECMRCIVFVERVIVSMVVAKLISRFLPSLPCDYMSGSGHQCSRTANQQQEILEKFSSGELNLLVATSVAEEGLDVQKCSSVIRFDLSLTMRSNVQSRGRARKLASKYTWLLERGNLEHETLLKKLTGSENLMREEVKLRSTLEISREPPPEGDLEVFRVESGACRTTEDSVSFIYRYCSKLPGDSYYNPRPTFSFSEVGMNTQLFVCTVKFPPNAPLRSVEGSPRRTMELAKKAACLKSSEKLLEIGAIRSDTLCPDPMEADEEDEVMPKDPTGKPLDLCFSAKPRAFKASWLRNPGEVHLQVYRICFSESRKYSRFALLIEGVLDEEILSSEMILYSRSKELKTSVFHAGETQLNPDQVNVAKAFQELLFNALFRRMELQKNGAHWDESEAYLLLPLSERDDSIDWRSVFSAAEAMKTFSQGFPDKLSTSFGSKLLFTAGGNIPASELLDSIVITVHSEKLFCVTGVLEHLNSESLLSDERCSYIEYFKNKHRVVLCYPTQPLLKVKPTHNFHNNLQRLHGVIENEDEKQEKRRSFVELPPELCLFTGVRSSVINSLYLLPSFMHRFTGLIRASQLKTITFSRTPQIPVTKLLEALTSKKCQEPFSLESLELLGDSFLKYCVTRRLFLVFSGKHEGQLSARRSRATCNSTLNQLAKDLGISEYIRSELFIPSCWKFPGIFPPEKLRCEHDPSKLTSSNKQDLLQPECMRGHRFISWKVLADVVEAIIGAFLVSSGEEVALEVMSSMGIEVKFDESLIDSVRARSFPFEFSLLGSLEEKLNYTFKNKSLLVEAITHASLPDASACYQRLEFLGDGALDFVVSKHLFEAHPGLPPGKLTDLRSAAVNNDCFARVVARHGLYEFLRYESEELDAQVREFVSSSKDEPTFGFSGPSGPKVLADLLESLAGAVLVDSGFDLDRLWEVVKALLWPIVTPETLPLQPVRELQELCGTKNNCEFQWDDLQKMITVRVKLGEQEFVEDSHQANKKEAKKAVARKMLLTLERLGLRHQKNKFHTQEVTDELASNLALTENHREQSNNNFLWTRDSTPRASSNSIATYFSEPEASGDSFLAVPPLNIAGEAPQSQNNSSLIYSSRGVLSDISSFLHDVCTRTRQRPFESVEEIVNTAMTQLQEPDNNFQHAGTSSEPSPVTQPNNSLTIFQPGVPQNNSLTIFQPASSQTYSQLPAMQSNNSLTIFRPPPAAQARFSELPANIANKIDYPGGPRAFLHDFCVKKKWGRPVFDFDFSGPPHSRMFQAKVTIAVHTGSKVDETSDYMPDKKKAMDDASRRILHRLVELGFVR